MQKREICSSPDFAIQKSNKYRIPTSSSIVLGATISRPVSDGKFPVLIWNDPYRSGSDGNASGMARYFAERGYAFCYLNSRGTENSEGISIDECMAEETQDSCDAIAWLTGQPWCSGKAGRLSSSCSGFTTLQVAARTPPALKAIAPAYFTDRRFRKRSVAGGARCGRNDSKRASPICSSGSIIPSKMITGREARSPANTTR